MMVHPDAFRRQMGWLRRLGYQGLSLREALPYIEGKRTGKVAAITFDDGFVNVLENAAPILREHGFTATNFIVVNQIGGWNNWDADLGVAPADCMTVGQLRQWAALGHEIGSHTLDHVHLTQTADGEVARQMRQSRQALEELAGGPITGFAYPYGEHGREHRIMAREAGFSYAVTTERRRVRAGDDMFGLPRLTVRRNDTWLHFVAKCVTR
jgi:peptidoglycan/xylan/chitin deacetylase (PgdA/CDA1 family)